MAHIRRASSSDGPALARLRWNFREEEGEAPLDDFKTFLPRFLEHYWHGLDTGSWAHWIIEDDGTILAHMSVRVLDGVPRPAVPRNRWGWLTNCYTIPEERNRGHGASLLQAIRTWAVAEGFDLLLVSPSDRSVPFYARAGFGPAGEWLQLSLEPPRSATESPP
jgi:GNAT superfamily N-acetyltransferase